MSELAVRIENVKKSYAAGRRAIPAVRDLSFTIQRGEFVTITGPSGCGKSTLLNLVTGIDRADDGTLEVLDVDLQRLSQDRLARWRGAHVGIVFQFFQLMPTLTALENVILPMDLLGVSSDVKPRGEALLDRVGLAGLANNLPGELSGGEQQRVAIARALANDPAMIVADEPTGNLDSKTGASVMELLRDVWRSGATLIIVTHDHEIADQAPRRISMLDGRIVDDRRTPTPQYNHAADAHALT